MAFICPECDGLGYTIPNIGDEEEDALDYIEHCIVCKVYESDREAALVMSITEGRKLRWARPPGSKEYKPYLVS